MPGPLAGVVVRYAVTRVGSFVGRKAVTTFGKKTASKRMQAEAAKRGGIALAPAPQGPFVGPIYHAHDYMSRGGEHASSSGTPYAGTSRPGPSAQTKSTRQRRRSAKRKPARRMRAIPRKGKKCPPGYRYDVKRKMCIQTFKR